MPALTCPRTAACASLIGSVSAFLVDPDTPVSHRVCDGLHFTDVVGPVFASFTRTYNVAGVKKAIISPVKVVHVCECDDTDDQEGRVCAMCCDDVDGDEVDCPRRKPHADVETTVLLDFITSDAAARLFCIIAAAEAEEEAAARLVRNV